MSKNFWQLTPEEKQKLGKEEVKRLHDEAVEKKIMPDGFDPEKVVVIHERPQPRK